MARLKAPFDLSGTIGNTTFVQLPNGTVARKKTSLNGKKILKDVSYTRTREQISEFSHASSAGAVIRRSLHHLLLDNNDGSCVNRLTQRLTKLIQSDYTSARGERNLGNSEWRMLQGFEFNSGSCLSQRLLYPYDLSFDRSTGTINLDFGTGRASSLLNPPDGSTGFKIILAASPFSSTQEQPMAVIAETDFLDFSEEELVPPVSVAVPAAVSGPVIICIGIEFFEVIGRHRNLVNKGKDNCLGLVRVVVD